jgi:hypothetical protein
MLIRIALASNSSSSLQTLLMATCQVIVAELVRHKTHQPLNRPVTQEEQSLMDAIETVLGVMKVFAQTCQLISSFFSGVFRR